MKGICVLFALIAAVVTAAGPVGRLTSSGPVTLNGKPLPETAVASLPVVAGDGIATLSAAAVIVFMDRSRAMIQPNSQVQLEPAGASVQLRVLSGSAAMVGTSASIDRATVSCARPRPRSRRCWWGRCGFGDDDR